MSICMMNSHNEDKDRKCPCRSFEGGEFQEIIDLKNICLAVYKYVPRYIRGFEVNTDIYVFYNYNECDITSSEYILEFEKNKKTCPQCCFVTEKAQDLLRHIPMIKGKNVKGTCQKCGTLQHACVPCEETKKRFAFLNSIKLYDVKDKQKHNFNLWQKKVHELLLTKSDQKIIDYLDLNVLHYSNHKSKAGRISTVSHPTFSDNEILSKKVSGSTTEQNMDRPFFDQFPDLNKSFINVSDKKLMDHHLHDDILDNPDILQLHDTLFSEENRFETYEIWKTKQINKRQQKLTDTENKKDSSLYSLNTSKDSNTPDLKNNTALFRVKNQSPVYNKKQLPRDNTSQKHPRTMNLLDGNGLKREMNSMQSKKRVIKEQNLDGIDTELFAETDLKTDHTQHMERDDNQNQKAERKIYDYGKEKKVIQQKSKNTVNNINEKGYHNSAKTKDHSKGASHGQEVLDDYVIKALMTEYQGNEISSKTEKSVTHLRGGATKQEKQTTINKNGNCASMQKNENRDRLKKSTTAIKIDNNANKIKKICTKSITDKKKEKLPETQMKILKKILAENSKKKIENFRTKDHLISNLPIVIKHHTHTFDNNNCIICKDSDVNLDLEKWNARKNEVVDPLEVVHSEMILYAKDPEAIIMRPIEDKKPILFQSVFDNLSSGTIFSETTTVSSNPLDTKGVLKYTLSDRECIDKGWTLLPVEKVIRKYMVYRMRPAQPEFDWFVRNKSKGLIKYETGEKFAEFDNNGRGRWFYKNGRLALDYYDSEELNAKHRIVIYSNKKLEPKGRGHPVTVLAIFDYIGNGIVFDHCGKIRLKYTQSEGVVLDPKIGPMCHWKWHSLNEPPVLERIMAETHLKYKDPEIIKMGNDDDPANHTVNIDVLEIERDNFVKETQKKTSLSYRPYQIKVKALKINENFSLKIMQQEKIHIFYRNGSTQCKLNIGMILDNKEIVDVHSEDIGKVTTSVEQLPARTDSLEQLQRYIEKAKHTERARIEHWRRLGTKMMVPVSSLQSFF